MTRKHRGKWRVWFRQPWKKPRAGDAIKPWGKLSTAETEDRKNQRNNRRRTRRLRHARIALQWGKELAQKKTKKAITKLRSWYREHRKIWPFA